MRNLFSYDGLIYRFFSTVCDLILINLLWLVCSIPLITIGAATTAAHYSCQKYARGEGTLFRNFFHAFRQNWKQATVIWLLILLLAASFLLDYSLLIPLIFPGKMVVVVILWTLIFLCVMAVHYVFPLIAQFENTLAAIKPDMTIFFQLLIDLPLYMGSAEEVATYYKESLYEDLTEEQSTQLYTLTTAYLERLNKNTITRQASQDLMRKTNPRFILRNYLLHQAIEGLEKGESALFEKLQKALREPYSNKHDEFFETRPGWATQKAGCSMLSCSS